MLHQKEIDDDERYEIDLIDRSAFKLNKRDTCSIYSGKI
jgi:hypothetical protein